MLVQSYEIYAWVLLAVPGSLFFFFKLTMGWFFWAKTTSPYDVAIVVVVVVVDDDDDAAVGVWRVSSIWLSICLYLCSYSCLHCCCCCWYYCYCSIFRKWLYLKMLLMLHFIIILLAFQYDEVKSSIKAISNQFLCSIEKFSNVFLNCWFTWISVFFLLFVPYFPHTYNSKNLKIFNITWVFKAVLLFLLSATTCWNVNVACRFHVLNVH